MSVVILMRSPVFPASVANAAAMPFTCGSVSVNPICAKNARAPAVVDSCVSSGRSSFDSSIATDSMVPALPLT